MTFCVTDLHDVARADLKAGVVVVVVVLVVESQTGSPISLKIFSDVVHNIWICAIFEFCDVIFFIGKKSNFKFEILEILVQKHPRGEAFFLRSKKPCFLAISQKLLHIFFWMFRVSLEEFLRHLLRKTRKNWKFLFFSKNVEQFFFLWFFRFFTPASLACAVFYAESEPSQGDRAKRGSSTCSKEQKTWICRAVRRAPPGRPSEARQLNL